MKLTIRGLVAEDRAAFRDLMAQRPGFTPQDAEARTNLVWHIAFDNPVKDDKPTYFVATDGTRILCHMARMPTVFQIGETRHKAAFAHDLFAHPELQQGGAGFFTTMRLYKNMEAVCESFCCLVWTNDINTKLQQSRKYTQTWVKRWARPLDLSSQLQKVLPAGPLRDAAGTVGSGALRVADAALGLMGRVRVEPIARADERFDRLAARVGPKLGIAPVKDSAYVDWKYFRWPNIKVTVLAALDDNDEFRGFCVLREPQNVAEPGRMLDLVVDPSDDPACASLLRHSIATFRTRGLSRIECMATFPAQQRVLSQFMFREREPAFPFFFLNDGRYSDPAYLTQAAHWSHAYGDSEGGEIP